MTEEKILRKTVIYEIIQKNHSKPILDRRTSFSRNRQIIETLMSVGYTKDDVIPYEDVEYAINIVRGSDPRTVKAAFKQLVTFHFLEPATKNIVRDRKTIMIAQGEIAKYRTYSSKKCYASYRFGFRAPASYQMRFTPPASPRNKTNECLVEKNVCVVRDEKVKGFTHGVSVREPSTIKKINNNNTVTHTHISCKNTAKTEEGPSKFLHENDSGLLFLKTLEEKVEG